MTVQVRSTTQRRRQSKVAADTLYIKHLKSGSQAGKYLVRVPNDKDEQGRTLYKNFGPFAGFEEAKAKRDLHLAALKADDATPAKLGREAKPMTLTEWSAHWLEVNVRAEASATTYDQYKAAMLNNVLPKVGELEGLGNIPVKALTKTRIETWREALKLESTVSMATYALKRLKTCLQAATEDFDTTGLRLNPARYVKLPEADDTTTEYEGHPTDVARLTVVAGDHYLALLPRVATDGGFRRSEILALHWEDVDWDNSQLVLRWHLVASGRASRGDHITAFRPGTKAKQTKGASKGRLEFERVNMPRRSMEALKAHRARLVEQKMSSRAWASNVGRPDPAGVFYAKNKRDRSGTPYIVPQDPADPKALIFPSADGTPMQPNSLGSWFSKLTKRAGIRKTLHGMRHDCGSFMLRELVPLTVVSAHLRHKNTAITAEIYSHMLPDDARMGADALDRLWDRLDAQAVAV